MNLLIKKCVYKIMRVYVASAFLACLVLPATPGFTQTLLSLPAPGTLIATSSSFSPVIMAGMSLYPDNPLKFDFIISNGDEQLQGAAFKAESQKLIHYFLTTLTVPENEMWVNLSPYEENRIIANGLAQTEMGRDMLAQDYMLKQLTASLMMPDGDIGQAFWDKIQARMRTELGVGDVPANIFNKVWIVPQEAVVFVHEANVFVSESHLKVMLEEDYLALEENRESVQPEHSDISAEAKALIREIILPEIEAEVNQGKNFAPLRQIYHSMILATWYKQNLRNSVLGQSYVDQNKMQGIDLADKNSKEQIYQQYLNSFKTGAVNFIREEYDPQTQAIIPKKYFSGGLKGAAHVRTDTAMLAEGSVMGKALQGKVAVSRVGFQGELTYKKDVSAVSGQDHAMLSQEQAIQIEAALDAFFQKHGLVFDDMYKFRQEVWQGEAFIKRGPYIDLYQEIRAILQFDRFMPEYEHNIMGDVMDRVFYDYMNQDIVRHRISLAKGEWTQVSAGAELSFILSRHKETGLVTFEATDGQEGIISPEQKFIYFSEPHSMRIAINLVADQIIFEDLNKRELNWRHLSELKRGYDFFGKKDDFLGKIQRFIDRKEYRTLFTESKRKLFSLHYNPVAEEFYTLTDESSFLYEHEHGRVLMELLTDGQLKVLDFNANLKPPELIFPITQYNEQITRALEDEYPGGIKKSLALGHFLPLNINQSQVLADGIRITLESDLRKIINNEIDEGRFIHVKDVHGDLGLADYQSDNLMAAIKAENVNGILFGLTFVFVADIDVYRQAGSRIVFLNHQYLNNLQQLQQALQKVVQDDMLDGLSSGYPEEIVTAFLRRDFQVYKWQSIFAGADPVLVYDSTYKLGRNIDNLQGRQRCAGLISSFASGASEAEVENLVANLKVVDPHSALHNKTIVFIPNLTNAYFMSGDDIFLNAALIKKDQVDALKQVLSEVSSALAWGERGADQAMLSQAQARQIEMGFFNFFKDKEKPLDEMYMFRQEFERGGVFIDDKLYSDLDWLIRRVLKKDTQKRSSFSDYERHAIVDILDRSINKFMKKNTEVFNFTLDEDHKHTVQLEEDVPLFFFRERNDAVAFEDLDEDRKLINQGTKVFYHSTVLPTQFEIGLEGDRILITDLNKQEDFWKTLAGLKDMYDSQGHSEESLGKIQRFIDSKGYHTEMLSWKGQSAKALFSVHFNPLTNEILDLTDESSFLYPQERGRVLIGMKENGQLFIEDFSINGGAWIQTPILEFNQQLLSAESPTYPNKIKTALQAGSYLPIKFLPTMSESNQAQDGVELPSILKAVIDDKGLVEDELADPFMQLEGEDLDDLYQVIADVDVEGQLKDVTFVLIPRQETYWKAGSQLVFLNYYHKNKVEYLTGELQKVVRAMSARTYSDDIINSLIRRDFVAYQWSRMLAGVDPVLVHANFKLKQDIDTLFGQERSAGSISSVVDVSSSQIETLSVILERVDSSGVLNDNSFIFIPNLSQPYTMVGDDLFLNAELMDDVNALESTLGIVVTEEQNILDAVWKGLGSQRDFEKGEGEGEGDSAMIADPIGGIDFNPAAMNLKQQGAELNFTIDNSMLQGLDINAVEGILPVIINITPITNFVPLLGSAAETRDFPQLSKR